MLKPKEKAKHLIHDFLHMGDIKKAIEHALICVDEILGSCMCEDTEGCRDDPLSYYRNYWKQVRLSIENFKLKK